MGPQKTASAVEKMRPQDDLEKEQKILKETAKVGSVRDGRKDEGMEGRMKGLGKDERPRLNLTLLVSRGKSLNTLKLPIHSLRKEGPIEHAQRRLMRKLSAGFPRVSMRKAIELNYQLMLLLRP